MVDRPTHSMPTDPNSEDEHTDLLATLAAARELGPDMDKALAESYMQRRKASTPARPRNTEPRPPVDFGYVLQAVLPVILIVAIISALSFGLFHPFGWLFLFPLFWGGMRWRRGWGYRNGGYGDGRYDRYSRRLEERDERRAQRDEWRRARRDDHYDWS